MRTGAERMGVSVETYTNFVQAADEELTRALLWARMTGDQATLELIAALFTVPPATSSDCHQMVRPNPTPSAGDVAE